MTDQHRDLVLLSGGMDSATALAQSATTGTAVLALTVDYGQRHRREIQAAQAIAKHYDVPHQILDLSAWGSLLSGSALTDHVVPVPHGHYTAPSMAITVVPGRNATFLAAAAGIAQARGANRVVTAVHAGDHTVYADCRPDFFVAIRDAIEIGTDDAVTVAAPFVHITKAAIAARTRELGVPLHLTWSCYKGGAEHCGKCGTCVERREAFTLAEINDPTSYEGEEAP